MYQGVLVCLGCCNKIPPTGGLINNRNFFLKVLEAGSPRSGSRHGQVRALCQVTDFLYLHMAEGARELSGLLYKDINPIHESSALEA